MAVAPMTDTIEFENEKGLSKFNEDMKKLMGIAPKLVRKPRGCPRQNQKAIAEALKLAYELGLVNGRIIEGRIRDLPGTRETDSSEETQGDSP